MIYRAMDSEIFSLPASFERGHLAHALQKAFPGIQIRRRRAALALFDTFDWRLWAKGRLLVREEATFRLQDARSGRLLAEEKAHAKHPPRFWWQWPAGPLQDYLQEATDVRALMQWIALQTQVACLNVLDGEEKTVVRLVWEAAAANSPADTDCLQVVKLLAVRGYRDEWQAAHAVLTEAGMTPGAAPLPIAVLKQRGVRPGAYAPKADIPLAPEMAAGAAAGAILAHLLEVMRQNEDGLRRDLDTEFLHDFRVAVRRARSLLALLNNVFAPAVLQALKADLQAAGKATNRQRDLDVYLLDQRHYEDLVPEALRPGIRPLFATLKRRRGQARKRTLAYLDAEDYRRLAAHIEAFVRHPADGASPAPARQPVQLIASRVIAKCRRKIVKIGRRIDAATPDSELHRLRIACKKLRYALEFFTTLYPADEMKLLIKQLKALQDNLGRFNDLAVQQGFLHAYLKTLDARQPQAVGVAAATGALIGRLHQEYGQVRQAFEKVFSAFNAPENGDRYARLFARGENPS
jgi:CHAD domain-containing protein